MQEAFGIVVVAVVVAAAIVAIVTLAGTGRVYGQIGRGGLSLGDHADRPAHEPALGGMAAIAERDAEIRQLLEARNARRVRRAASRSTSRPSWPRSWHHRSTPRSSARSAIWSARATRAAPGRARRRWTSRRPVLARGRAVR